MSEGEIIKKHHPIDEPLTLQDLKDKWDGRIKCWLVESVWITVRMSVGRADAALEILMEERKRAQDKHLEIISSLEENQN